MKKWVLPLTIVTTLAACSSNNVDKQAAGDSYEKYAQAPTFITLDSGGVNLPAQDPTYHLPVTQITKGNAVDIRPPSNPMAIIGDSVAQFDGERSSIVYSSDKRAVYNLQQVQRLLTEKKIPFTLDEDGSIHTDWSATGRTDDVGNTQIRYQIREVGNNEANALVVSVLQMKRNDIIFTPTVTEKQRYTSDRLNQLVGELNVAYRTQQQQLNLTADNSPIQSAIATDDNGRTALALNAAFNHSWHKLGNVLPMLGFEIKENSPGHGSRTLAYKPLDEKVWLRLGVTRPDLKKGEYYMQLTANGKQSAVVLSNEDKAALSGDQAQTVYQALQVMLAK